MKRIALTAAALILTAGIAQAAPFGQKSFHAKPAAKQIVNVKLTLRERLRIARSNARLKALQRRARGDGRVTRRERARLQQARKRHRALVRHERRD